MAETALTHRRVLGIALPVVISNITVPLLGLVDTGVVGQIDDPVPLGAVGIGAIILTSVYWIFGFLRMGTTGLVAQAHGAGEADEVAAIMGRGLLIGLGAGAVLILVQPLVMALGFWMSPASAAVEGLAREYVAIRIWSAPAAIAVYAITGWLIGLERTGAVLVLQVVMNGVNILLDLWFVLGLGWGVPGVAWATFAAEWSGVLLGLWLCRGAFAASGWMARLWDVVRLRRMMQVSGDILIRSVLLQAIFVSFLMWSGGLGDVQLAANQVLIQFVYFIAYGLDGFAFAAEALVGQAVGQRRRGDFRRAVWATSLWGLVVCVLLSAGFALVGGTVVAVLAESDAVQAEAGRYLVWVVLAPLAGLGAFMLDGIFIGATRTRDMRDMMVVSAAVYFACAVPLVSLLGNHGLWLALIISFMVRGLTLAWRYPALERSVSEPV